MKIQFKKRFHFSLLYKYFISYLIILIIPTGFIGYMVHNYVLDKFEKEILTNSFYTLSEFSEIYNERMKEIKNIAVHVSQNPQLARFHITNELYGTYRAVTELKKYCATNFFISDLFLYYKENKRIYAASGSYDIDTLLENAYQYNNWDKTQFMQDMEQATQPYIRSNEEVIINKLSKEEYITFIYPIPLYSRVTTGTLIIPVNSDKIRSIIDKQFSSYNGNFYLLDDRGQKIFQYSSNTDYAIDDIFFENLSSGTISTYIDGEEVLVSCVKLEGSGWMFITAFPANQVMEKVIYVRNITMATIAFFLILGPVIAFIFSSRNYKPIKRIAKTMMNDYRTTDTGERKYSNEIDIINNVFKEIKVDYNMLSEKLENQKRIVRDQVLMMLLKDKFESEVQMEMLLGDSKLVFDKKYVTAIALLIDHYNNFISTIPEHIQKMLKLSTTHKIEEFIDGKGYFVQLIENDTIILIFNQDNAEYKSEVIGIVNNIQIFFKDYYNCTVTAGVGHFYEKCTDLNRSFVEALVAVKYRLIKGNGQIIFFDDITLKANENYWYPIEQIKKLTFDIKKGDGDSVESDIRNLVNKIIDHADSIYMAWCICFDIVNSVIKCFNEIREKGNNKGFEEILQAMIQFETVEDLCREMISFSNKLCSQINERKLSRNYMLRDEVIQYINDNLTDVELSLQKIANHIGITVPYLSSYFKEQIGYPPIKYISQQRIDLSKQLLRSTDAKISEISEKVGYINSTSFIRMFKSYEGITPQHFRFISGKNGEAGE